MKKIKTVLLLSSAMLALAFLAMPVLSQDDADIVPAKVLDASNRPIGRAELILDTGAVKTDFGYNVKLWLDGGRLVMIRPQSGSRSSSINCSFTEFKVDSRDPKNTSSWNETGSGSASLQMSPSGEVKRITGSMSVTTRYVGVKESSVQEKPVKFVIVVN